jgi:hypothetical protein
VTELSFLTMEFKEGKDGYIGCYSLQLDGLSTVNGMTWLNISQYRHSVYPNESESEASD